jgi:hypothetical protein
MNSLTDLLSRHIGTMVMVLSQPSSRISQPTSRISQPSSRISGTCWSRCRDPGGWLKRRPKPPWDTQIFVMLVGRGGHLQSLLNFKTKKLCQTRGSPITTIYLSLYHYICFHNTIYEIRADIKHRVLTTANAKETASEKPRTGQVSGQGVSEKHRSGQVYFLGFRVFGLVFFLFFESGHGGRTDGDRPFGPRYSSINLTAFNHRFLHKGPVPHFVLIVSEILEAPPCRTEVVQVCLRRNLGLPLW